MVSKQICACYEEEGRRKSVLLREIQCALEGALFVVDFLLQLENGVENGLGTWRTAGNVDIDGNHLVAALNDGVVIENAAGRRARAHGDDPLRLGHLIVKLAD